MKLNSVEVMRLNVSGMRLNSVEVMRLNVSGMRLNSAGIRGYYAAECLV